MSNNIPDSVREQHEKAQAMMEEIKRNRESVKTEAEGQVEQQEEQSQEVIGAVEDVQPVETYEQEQVEQEKERNDYKAMYHTLKGKYDAEVPRLRSTTVALEKRLVELENMLASVQSQPQKQEPAAPPEDVSITADEREAFGDDLLAVVEKQAKAVMLQREAEYRAQIEELKAQLGQFGQTTQQVQERVKAFDQTSFLNAMRQRVPEFDKIDSDPKFLSWLEEVEPYSGVRKIDLLREAGSRLDVERAAAFFDSYLSGSRPQQKQSNALEQQIAPSKGTAGAPYTKGSQSNRVFSRSEITQFYRDVVEGKYKGREAEQQQLEREIVAAGKGGRIK